MHLTYFFVKELCRELKLKYVDFQIIDSFTTAANEWMLEIYKDQQVYFLQVNLNKNFNALRLLKDYKRPNHNTIDIFSQTIKKRIKNIIQVPFDRSFYILLNNESKLLFKFHGNQSNIILLNQHDEVVEILNKKLDKDNSIELMEMQNQRPEEFTIQNPIEFLENLRLLDKKSKQLAISELESSLNPQDWLINFLQTIENPKIFYFNENDISVSLFPFNSYNLTYTTALELSSQLYFALNYQYFFTIPKGTIIREKELEIKQLEKQINSLNIKKKYLTENGNLREKADVVMANLHIFNDKERKYNLLNFYNNSVLEIELKRLEKPQILAQRWYSKSKNQHKELDHIDKNIGLKEETLKAIQRLIVEIQGIDSPRELSKYIKNETVKETQNQKPYFKTTHFQGLEIWIGRNADNNDELVKLGHKDDLWFHAKDVAGSHVLIRTKQNSKISHEIIEYAASLAANYSKRKSDSLCPVQYTQLKYVKKRKGFRPGQVSVEMDKVILVKPLALGE